MRKSFNRVWGVIACCFVMSQLAKAQDQVQFLNQNWTPEVRQSFYTTSQGSRIMPYEWFLALEVADSEDSFLRTRIPELGYLANDNLTDNPDRLPVGFVADEHAATGRQFIGLTCAACHTGQVQHGGTTFQIDGAPTLADMWGLLSGIDESLQATRHNTDKFKRFANHVLGSDAGDLVKATRLQQQLDEFLDYWSQFIEDSRVEHPWGRGRLDAFGMIFNRVTSIDLGIPKNSKKPDAPVSYPFLWGTSFQNVVQWNGSADNENDVERLGRNVGEVLGVFAQAEFGATSILKIPKPARTSAKRLNQVRLENHLKTLWSPQWPTELGAIDSTKAAAGAALYQTHCVSCHTLVAHGEQDTPIEVEMTLVSEVKTDPKMALNAASGKSATGDLKNLFGGRSRVPRGEMLQRLVRLSLVSPFRDVKSGGLLEQLVSDDVFSPSEIAGFLREIGFTEKQAMALLEAKEAKLKSYYKDLRKTIKAVKRKDTSALTAEAAPPTLKYKAAPLAGIWATAPYLHNGSVPNLYELLLPSEQRSKTFSVGSRKFDPKKVGFETTATPGSSLFDTAAPGNSNAGHDMYGTFTEAERMQLVEYMKTL